MTRPEVLHSIATRIVLASIIVALPTSVSIAETIEFVATIDSAQALGCIGESSAGTGSATYSLDTDTGQVDYFIEVSNASSQETAAHIHGPAIPCEFEDILVILPPGSPKVGFYVLDPDEMQDMLAGLHFSLFHTQMWPQGELRGQILPVSTEEPFIRGDCNGDSGLDIADAITGLGILFSGDTPSLCESACDANDDDAFDIADQIHLLAGLFSSGPAPTAPYPTCGPDPTPDLLPCFIHAACP